MKTQLQYPILRVEKLSIQLKNKPSNQKIIDELSFDVEYGKTLGIIGNSGSGKSMTVMALMGLLDLSCWEINALITTFNSNDKLNNTIPKLFDYKEWITSNNQFPIIRIVFQDPLHSLNPVLKIKKSFLEVLSKKPNTSFGNMNGLMKNVFEKVQLFDFERILNAYPFQLSGGELQRICIALALIESPDILIADEPTSSLDFNVQFEILSLLKQIQKEENLSMIFISHDMYCINFLSDKIIAISKGKILADSQILNNTEIVKAKQLQKVDNSNVVLEINHLNHSFDKKFLFQNKNALKILNDISFRIFKGEILGILGSSGSGKSTIANIIEGIIESKNLEIFLNGANLSTLPIKLQKEKRKKIQMVFQNPTDSLNPKLKIGLALEEVISLIDPTLSQEKVNAKAIEMLKLVGLDSTFFIRYPFQLSGGQKQRVSIAKCLVSNPTLLICDESTSSLDIASQSQIIDLLKEIQIKTEVSILFISHNLPLVRSFCDRVLFINQGKIEESGPVEEIFCNPKSPGLQEYLKHSYV